MSKVLILWDTSFVFAWVI